jgi:pSer/pThr/pTyr-binding forkhead associated (FHA) protein
MDSGIQWAGWEGAVFTVGFSVFLVCLLIGLLLTRKRRGDPPVAARARLRDPEGRVHVLQRGLTRVGRKARVNDLVIARDTVSARHAVIEQTEAGCRVRDLGSANGTFLNGKRLGTEPADLRHGDRIRFDVCEYQFETADTPPDTPGTTRVRAEDPAEAPTLVKPRGKAQ